AFATGRARALGLAAIEAGDGLSYTAAFSERLVGDNQPVHPAVHNYRIVPPPLGTSGCPAPLADSSWPGDPASSPPPSHSRSTLYHHALPPNGYPSCIALDGQTAFMGASSGHVRGVNLLLLDGAVNLIRPSIDRKIWEKFARIAPPEPGGNAQ